MTVEYVREYRKEPTTGSSECSVRLGEPLPPVIEGNVLFQISSIIVRSAHRYDVVSPNVDVPVLMIPAEMRLWDSKLSSTVEYFIPSLSS